MNEIAIRIGGIAAKSFVSASVLLLFTRVMGKKQISQLTFFDYAVGVSIGSIAASLSVDRRIPFAEGIVSMLIWTVFPLLLSQVSIRSMALRKLLDGSPMILIQNGKILEENLSKAKLTLNDLLEELRIKDVFDIADVEYAIFETNGKLSVLKHAAEQTATRADLCLPGKDQGLCVSLIIDGKLMRGNLERIHRDEAWLTEELRRKNVKRAEEVLLASCDREGNLFVSLKNRGAESFRGFE